MKRLTLIGYLLVAMASLLLGACGGGGGGDGNQGSTSTAAVWDQTHWDQSNWQ